MRSPYDTDEEKVTAMGRTLDEMIDALAKDSRERVDARYRELKEKVERLRAASGDQARERKGIA